MLLVEDNAHVLHFAEQLLGELQCRVTAVDSAEKALALVDEGERFDLLFSDVIMPGMSGVELASAVRKTIRDLPVVLATGYSDEVIAGAGAQFEVLRKPYDSHTLGAAVVAAIERIDQVPVTVTP